MEWLPEYDAAFSDSYNTIDVGRVCGSNPAICIASGFIRIDERW